MSLPPFLLRRLPGLGHALSRLQMSISTLNRRTQKGSLSAQAEALLAAANNSKPTKELFILIGWRGQRWDILAYNAAAFEADASPPVLDAAMLLSCAILHLPSLRIALRKELRSARFARLRTALPLVWWRTDETIPPGATVAGLGISSWSALPQLLAKGRNYECVGLNAEGEETYRETISGKSDLSLAGMVTLIHETTGQPPFDGLLKAHYSADGNGRWSLQSTEQRLTEEGSWQAIEIEAKR
jgi:hypothetical protein